MKNLEKAVAGVCGVILLIVIVQSVFPSKYVPAPPKPPAQMAACIGTPINVAYAYTGAINDPWDCKVQCDDDKPRYLLYSNGQATQCETPPGCNDFGEDNGITCNPPAVKSTAE